MHSDYVGAKCCHCTVDRVEIQIEAFCRALDRNGNGSLRGSDSTTQVATASISLFLRISKDKMCLQNQGGGEATEAQAEQQPQEEAPTPMETEAQPQGQPPAEEPPTAPGQAGPSGQAPAAAEPAVSISLVVRRVRV